MAEIRIEPFDKAKHQRAGFSCGVPALDEFLLTFVTQYEKRRLGRTFVAVPATENTRVVGYYTLAAGAVASGVDPVIAGKPHQPLATLVESIVAERHGVFDPARVLMVGDRPETDGRFAALLGCRFALVRSGVSGAGAETDETISVDLDVADLAAVARRLVP